ncbi:MAG: hypothetical protein IPH97_17610 [Ignavibacteriales bacterium]|nr:hypothetical protein [Ignavibacteriales bacterium]
METIIEILKNLLPLWLVLIACGFGYLIYLFSKTSNRFIALSEKQTEYLKDKLETVGTATEIFERTVIHQEKDLKRLYELNEKLKLEIEKKKVAGLKSLDEQLEDISKNIQLLQKDEKQKNYEIIEIRKEIEAAKKATINKYDNYIKYIEQSEIFAEKKNDFKKQIFVATPNSELGKKRYNIIKEVAGSLNLEIVTMDSYAKPYTYIIQWIEVAIEESDILIYDLSERDYDVIYSFGFAQNLDKPIIVIGTDSKELGFNAFTYRTILFDDSDIGKKLLKESLITSLNILKEQTIKTKTNKYLDYLTELIPFSDILKILRS